MICGMVVWLKDSAQFGGVKVGRYFTGFGDVRFWYLGLGQSLNCARPSLRGVLECWILVRTSRYAYLLANQVLGFPLKFKKPKSVLSVAYGCLEH